MEKGQQWKWDTEHLTDPSAVAKNALPGVKNYVRDEMLGFDDFGNAAKHASEGNWWGAIKSGLTGVGELGLTVGTLGVGTGAKAVAKPVVKSAVKAATKAKPVKTKMSAAKKADEDVPTSGAKAKDEDVPAVGKAGKAGRVTRGIARGAAGAGAAAVSALAKNAGKPDENWKASAVV